MSRRQKDQPHSIVCDIVCTQILKEHDKNLKKPNYVYSPELYEAGQNWFDSGFKLEEAPEESRTNQNFINGYERAKRISIFSIKMYDEGVRCYDSGMSYEEVAEKFKNVPIAIKGYEDAMINCHSKSRK